VRKLLLFPLNPQAAVVLTIAAVALNLRVDNLIVEILDMKNTRIDLEDLIDADVFLLKMEAYPFLLSQLLQKVFQVTILHVR